MKKHYKPMYVGTQAERIAMTLSADAFGSMFWETDTSKWYKWTGTVWERSYTELDLQTSGGAQVHWNNLTNVPQLFEANFYPHDVASDVSPYSKLLSDPPSHSEDIDTAVVNSGSGEVLIEGYITEELNVILLQGGTWHFYNFNTVSATGGTTQMVIRVYKKASGGSETELFNVTTVAISNTTVGASAVEIMTVQPDFIVASTDRLLVKYFAKTTSVPSRTVSFYHDGTSHYSHIHTPFEMLTVASGGSSGVAIPFTSLTDVPGSYAGQAGKIVDVNGTETGLEFVTNAPDAANVTYTPADVTDWNSDADPGNTDDALDQLANRIDAVEAASTIALDDLSDVQAPSPSDGQILGYVGSVGLWEPVAAASMSGIAGNIEIGIDGESAAPSAGVLLDFIVPFNLTITGWTVIANASGSITVDLWKDTYANFPPDVSDTITGSDKPRLSSEAKRQDGGLTGWDTTWQSGDVVRVNIDSAATLTKATVSISYTRS